MRLGPIFLLFLAFAVLEVMVMSAVAGLIGWPLTLVLLIATGFVGSLLFRHQGMQTWTRLNQRMQAGEMPGQELVEGVMLLIGSVGLITPGFITDGIGLLLLLPPTRKRAAKWLIAKGKLQAFSSFKAGGFHAGGFSGGFPPGGNVYEGEVKQPAANDSDNPDAPHVLEGDFTDPHKPH